MYDDVKKCIKMRKDFIDDYFAIPDDLADEMEAFFRGLETLGEECRDSTEFEARFADEGYSDTFNSLYPRCPQKPMSFSEAARDLAENPKVYSVKGIGETISGLAAVDAEHRIKDEVNRKLADNDAFQAVNETKSGLDSFRSILNFFGKKKD